MMLNNSKFLIMLYNVAETTLAIVGITVMFYLSYILFLSSTIFLGCIILFFVEQIISRFGSEHKKFLLFEQVNMKAFYIYPFIIYTLTNAIYIGFFAVPGITDEPIFCNLFTAIMVGLIMIINAILNMVFDHRLINKIMIVPVVLVSISWKLHY